MSTQRNLTITIEKDNKDHDKIYIGDIESIVNFSCDNITIACLEFIDENNHPLIIKCLLDKLRPLGKLSIVFLNTKIITQNYLQSKILAKDFLNYFRHKNSILSVESIYTYIDFKVFDIINIHYNSDLIQISIERKKSI